MEQQENEEKSSSELASEGDDGFQEGVAANGEVLQAEHKKKKFNNCCLCVCCALCVFICLLIGFLLQSMASSIAGKPL